MGLVENVIKKFALAISASLMVSTANSAVTFYSNQADFEAAAGPTTIQTFDLPSEAAFHTTPVNVGDFTISMEGTPNTASNLNKIDIPPFGFNVVNVDGSAVANVQLNSSDDTLTLTFDSPIVSIGMDLASLNDGVLRTRISVGGESSSPVATPGTVRFFGVTSDVAFNHLVFSYNTATDLFGIDNVRYSFASASSPVNGVCGTDNGQLLSVAPTNLCSVGDPSVVSGFGPWSWSCAGSNGGADASCSADVTGPPPTPVDGQCGSDDGATLTQTPSNLCTSGDSSLVTGFAPWSWSCFGTNGGSDTVCRADFGYQLNVLNSSNGGITSTPGGINCGSTCSANFIDHSSVTLLASPASGYQFDSWSGDCSGQTSASCTLLMDAAKSVSASFALIPVDGACGAANGVAVLSAPTNNLCASGNPTTVNGTTGPWDWQCQGTGVGSTSQPCSAPKANSYTITPYVSSGDHTGSLSPATPQTVIEGGGATFTASAAQNYRLDSVTGCGGVISNQTAGGASYSIAPASQNCTVSAAFSYAVVDTDGDLVPDNEDAYPSDPAHSVQSRLIVAPSGTQQTGEDGTSVPLTVRLSNIPAVVNQPNSPPVEVTLSLVSSNIREGIVTPATLVLSEGNGYQASFTVSGVADGVIDQNQSYKVDITVTGSLDATYSNPPLTTSVNLVNVNVDQNRVPLAIQDTGLSVLEGGSLSFNLLTNDTDADGDSLSAILDSGPPGLSLTSAGLLSYQHDGGETSPLRFSYHVNDGLANSNSVENFIDVEPVNDPATIVGEYSTSHNSGVAYSQLLVIEDPDLAPQHRQHGVTLTVSNAASGLNETAIWSATDHSFANGMVLTTFEANFEAKPQLVWEIPVAGNISLNWQLSDGEFRDQKQYTLVVREANNPPVANNPQPAVVEHNHSQGFSYDPQWTDSEGDALTFRAENLPEWIDAASYATLGILNGRPTLGDVGNSYLIRLAASDGWAESAPVEFTLTVTNNQPEVSLSLRVNGANVPNPQQGSIQVNEGDTVQISLAGSDADGDVLEYLLSPVPVGANWNSQTGQLNWLTDNRAVGSHTLQLGVSDGAAEVSAGSITLEVFNTNNPPQITNTSLPRRLVAGQNVNLSISAIDPDLDHLDKGVYINDKPEALTLSAQSLPPGLNLASGTGQISGSPTGAAGSRYDTVFTVTDRSTAQSSRTHSFTINTPPQITRALTGCTLNNDALICDLAEGTLFNATLAASDGDQDAMTYSAINRPAWLNLNPGTGLLSGTPGNADVTASYVWTIQVSDGFETVDQQLQFSVSDTNNPPLVSGNHQLVVDVQQSVVVQLANLWATDADGLGQLVYTLTTAPAQGSLQLGGQALSASGQFSAADLQNGRVSYSHTGVIGSDSLVLSLSDGVVTESVTLNITINPVNLPPEILELNPGARTLNEDGNFSLDLNTLVRNSDSGDTLAFRLNQFPAEDSASLSPAGVLSYTPKADKNGSVTLNWQVSDGVNPAVPGVLTLIITPQNDAPIVQARELSTTRNTPLTFTLRGQDVDNDPLTLSQTTGPSNGVLEPLGDNRFRYTPNPDFEGVEALSYQASDGALQSTPAALTITVAGQPNRPPVAEAGYSVSTPEEQAVVLALPGSDVDVGDELSYRIVLRPEHGVLAPLSEAGAYRYTPDIDFNGSDQFTWQVVDTAGESSELVTSFVYVDPVNDPPRWQSPQLVDGEVSVAYTQTLSASDVDGDRLILTATGLPDWLSFSDNGDGTATLSGVSDQSGSFGPITLTVAEAGPQGVSDRFTGYINIAGSIPVVELVPPPGSYDAAQGISLSCITTSTEPCTVSYRIDNGQEQLYSQPIRLETSSQLVVFAEAGTQQGAETTHQYIIDTSDPRVVIEAPAAGSTLSTLTALNASFPLSVSAQDPQTDIERVEVQIQNLTNNQFINEQNGELLPGTTEAWIPLSEAGGSWSRTIDTTNWQDGDYQLTARATNSAGREGFGSSILYFNDTNAAFTEQSLNPSTRTLKPGAALDLNGRISIISALQLSAAGLELTLTIDAPSGYSEQHIVFTDLNGEWGLTGLNRFNEQGSYRLTIGFAGNSDLAASSASIDLKVGASSGYAIIVQGKNDSGEGQDSYQLTTDRIYEQLISHGLSDDDIYYYSHDATSTRSDGVPDKTTLRNLFNQELPAKLLGTPAAVTLFMVDHGESQRFLLNGSQDVITPAELDGWLSDLELRLPDASLVPRTVIVGACYSGSFIPALSGPGRTIVTSAAADEQSYKGPLENTTTGVRGGEYFIDALLQQWRGNTGLTEAFRQASEQTWDYTRDRRRDGVGDAAIAQNPQIDDNGDGLGSRIPALPGDGQQATDLTLGDGGRVSESSRQVPVSLFADRTATFQTLSYPGLADYVSVWVDVLSPSSSTVADGGTAQLINDADRLVLTYQANSDSWQGDYTNLGAPGRYDLFFFGLDAQGNLHSLQRGALVKAAFDNRNPPPVDLTHPAEGLEVASSAIFDWLPVVDVDGDSLTYQLEIARDRQFIDVVHRQSGIDRSHTWVTGTILQNHGAYYWRIIAIDSRGGRSSSAVASFNVRNSLGARAIVYGSVFSNNRPAVGVGVSDGETQALSDEQGNFVMVAPPLTLTLTAGGNGYSAQSLEVTTSALQAQSVRFNLDANGLSAAPQQLSVLEDSVDNEITLTGSGAIDYQIISQPQHGVLNASASIGTFFYTPATDFSGQDSFTFVSVANGEQSAVASVDLTIEAVNDIPLLDVGQAPSLPDIREGGNRYDGLALSAFSPAISDIDSNERAIQIEALTGNGWQSSSDGGTSWQALIAPRQIVINASNRLRYLPQGIGAEQQSLTFRAADLDGGLSVNSHSLNQTVLASNQPPTAGGVSLTTNEDTRLSDSTTLPANSSDAEGATLNFQLVQYSGSGLLTISNSGAIEYVPARDFNGGETASYRVTDSEGAFAEADITLNVVSVNDPPTVVGRSYTVSGERIIQLTAQDDNDAVLSIKLYPGYPLRGGLSHLEADRYVYTPNSGQSGADEILFSAIDSEGKESTPASIQITILATDTNTPPEAIDSELSGLEDVPINGRLQGRDQEGSVVYSIVSQPGNGALVRPDSQGAAFTYQPNENFNGVDSFVYRVSDIHGATRDATVTLIVNSQNDLPSISGSPLTLLRVGETYSFRPQTRNPDNETLRFSASGLPVWLRVDPFTGALSGIPTEIGFHPNIRLSVSDADDLVTLAPFDISVGPEDVSLPVSSASLAAGNYREPQQVALNCLGVDCVIQYRTNSSAAWQPYLGPLTIDRTTTLEFYASNSAGDEAPHHSLLFTIDGEAPQISITEPQGDAILSQLTQLRGLVSDNTAPPRILQLAIIDNTSGSYLDGDGFQPFPVFHDVSVNNGQWGFLLRNSIIWDSQTTYTLSIEGQDAAGNVGSSSLLFTLNQAITAFPTRLQASASVTTLRSGDRIVVSGKLNRLPDDGTNMSGKPINVTLSAADGAPLEQWQTTTYDTLGHFQVETSPIGFGKGQYSLTASYPGSPLLLSAEERLPFQIADSAGYAILIDLAGSASSQLSQQRISTLLKQRGFSDTTIYRLGSGAGDTLPVNAVNLQQALTVWAADQLAQPAPLYLIIQGSGSDLLIGSIRDYLTTLENQLLLASFQEPRIIVHGGAEGVQLSRQLDGAGRTIISSGTQLAGVEEPDGRQEFNRWLATLFSRLEQNDTLEQAYQAASDAWPGTQALSSEVDPLQSLGYANAFLRPRVIDAPTLQILTNGQSETLVEASFSANDQISIAPWIELVAPDQSRQSIRMTRAGDQWRVNVNSLLQIGRYDVHLFVKDKRTQTISDQRTTTIYQPDPDNQPPPAAELVNPSPQQAGQAITETATRLLFDWVGVSDPDGDEISYALTVIDDFGRVVFRKENIVQSRYLLTEPVLEDLTTYAWYVEAIDSRGGYSASLISYFHTDNTSGFGGLITGTVYSGSVINPVSGATIRFGNQEVQSYADGEYSISTIFAGELIASKVGFSDFSDFVDMSLTAELALDIPLSPDLTKDSDFDGVADEVDNCPIDSNADQLDFDGDGLGNECDDDDDNDRIPDTFENQYGMDPFDPGDAQGDIDNDGVINILEYQNGTDPTREEEPPVISLVGEAVITLQVGDTYTDAGATASDNFDGDLTASIVTTSDVDTSSIGSYTVSYDVSDAAGNAAIQVIRQVSVEADSGADTDQDGILDVVDNCPLAPNANQENHDGDLKGDVCDPDDDNDLIPDADEISLNLNPLDATDAQADRDGDGKTNYQEFLDGTSLDLDSVAPSLIAPADIEINATGIKNEVNLGEPQASDVVNGVQVAITATADRTGPFESGRHRIVWTATDAAGNSTTATQQLDIIPYVELSIDRFIGEGDSFVVPFTLSGRAVQYPITVDYVVSGTADSADHNAVNGRITFNESDELVQNLQVDIVSDGQGEGRETLIFDISNVINAALREPQTQTLTIVEENIAPIASLAVTQGAVLTRMIDKGQGLVTVTSIIRDPNKGQSHSYDWSMTNNNLVNTSSENGIFTFDPSNLLEGVYDLSLVVTDDGGLSSTVAETIRVRATQDALSQSQDSDGDGVVDAAEGIGDDDGDGVPNYLDDAGIPANVMPLGNNRALQVKNGLILKLGETAFSSTNTTATTTIEGIGAYLETAGGVVVDEGFTQHSEIFDFVVEGLPQLGDSVAVTIELQSPLPPNAVYRKLLPTQGWVTFEQDGNNAIGSGLSQNGNCPADPANYSTGLKAGDDCIRLAIEDGGPYDTDLSLNGRIADPGVVAVDIPVVAPPVTPPTTVEPTDGGDNGGDNSGASGGGGGGGGSFDLWLLLGLHSMMMFLLLSKQRCRASQKSAGGGGYW
jgi:hypothetical protein